MRAAMIFMLSCLTQCSIAQEIPMFIGTYTHAGSQGIYLYMFDKHTGDATMYSSTASEHPSFLARSANGDMLYAVNEIGDTTATLSSFTFDGDALSFVDAIPTGGASPCHVVVSKRHPLAIVSNYGGGSLSVYRLEKNGGIEQIQHIQQEGTGPNKERQEASHVHSAFFSPDEHRVYVQNLGTDKITIYRIDKTNDNYSLVEESYLSTPAGGGPRHLVFDEKGQNMYVLLEMAAKIVHYENVDGTWTLVDTVSINEDGFEGGNGAAEIKRSADGKFLYASNRGDANTIALFAIDKSGKLKWKRVYPTGGEGPRNFNISPDGRFLLVANQQTNNITIFERSQETGELKDTGKQIEVSTPVCIVF
ncbi:lactonase family protein [Sphingobacterium gobiense]|uniref:6-phosphogluconolactonase n=1 Tax=Sphingobacterium gobiense TaxID=1382456 RepID=A0A2S9JHY5_9SPHI|nr:lactonase family protein [Sphingobacterium gobiense]PRD52625.1 6-phosphogluconolactonase [Sphingobacterium gobiense]